MTWGVAGGSVQRSEEPWDQISLTNTWVWRWTQRVETDCDCWKAAAVTSTFVLSLLVFLVEAACYPHLYWSASHWFFSPSEGNWLTLSFMFMLHWFDVSRDAAWPVVMCWSVDCTDQQMKHQKKFLKARIEPNGESHWVDRNIETPMWCHVNVEFSCLIFDFVL